MKTKEAIRHFGSKYRIAQVLGIHRSAVGRWGANVPEKRAGELRTIAAMMGMERSLGGDPSQMYRGKRK